MPLTLITGRANSGKTRIAYDILLDRRPARLLVPSAPDARRATRALAERCSVGIAVSQIDLELARRWSAWGDGRRLVTDVQRMALCRAVCDEYAHARGADHPRGTAGTPGYPLMLAGVVRRLAEHAGDATAGREARGRADDPTPRLAQAYERALAEHGLVEPGEAYRVLAGSEDDSELLVVHRFTELGEAQERYLLARARSGAHVVITLVWEEGASALAATNDLAGRLLEAASEHIVATPNGPRHTVPELLHLEEHLFERPDPAGPGTAVRLLETVGELGEADALAREVVDMLQDGLQPQEIAIVYRDPARHAEPLRRALEASGVPVDLDVGRELAQTPLGAAFMDLLAFCRDLRRSDLASFAKSPFSGCDPDAADRADASWRGRRMEAGERLIDELGRVSSQAGRLVRQARESAARPLDERVATEWCEVLARMLRAAAQRASGPGPVDEEDAVARRVIVEAMRDSIALAPDGPSGQALAEVLGGLRVHPRRLERPGHVQVTSAERIRSRRFRAVLFGGLTADESPVRVESSVDRVVERLLGTGRMALERRERIDRERLLFYLVVTGASERLVLSRQTADSDGRARRASPLWEEVLDVYRDPCEEGLDSAGGTRSRPAGIVRRVGRPGEIEERAARATARYSRGIGSATCLWNECDRPTVSTSDVETYVRCPYKWLFERRLAPREMERRFGPMERGSVAHDILRIVYERLESATGQTRVTPENLEAALLLAEEVLPDALDGQPRTAGPQEEDAVARALELARATLRRDARIFSGFAPVALEWVFGSEEESAAGPVDLGVAELRGRVDRIDSDGQRLLVMDYKSGSTHAHAAFEREGLVQLPLYVAAARQAFGLPVVGAFYRSLRDGGNRGFLLRGAVEDPGAAARGSLIDQAGFDAIVQRGLDRARQAVEGMRAGKVGSTPVDPGVCEYCAAHGVCGRQT